MSPRRSEIQDKIENRDRIHVVLFFLSMIFLIVGAFILIRIVDIQTNYEVDSSVENLFRTTVHKHTDAPVRGRILACDGRPLAISAPLYDIYMDCTVRKEEFQQKNRKEDEEAWRRKAGELGVQLAKEFGIRSAADWTAMILKGRDKGSRYLRLKTNVDLTTLNRVKTFTLFKEGANKGGLIVNRHDERIYPYDSLARRVIGYVKTDNRIGIESAYDYALHGKEGWEWRRVTDRKTWIRDLDSISVKPVDGNDVRTTLNIDFQDIADKALRRQIDANDEVRGGLCIILEASTGAVRAMVNLTRGDTPQTVLWERDNLALREVGEQGSVMKTVTLLSLVQDGHVKSLDQTIPTNNGFVPRYPQDVHILDYQRETGKRSISVMHGFEISSNYVFTYLAENYYGKNPREMFDHIYSYKLGEAFDFDIPGMGTPVVNRPGSSSWSPNMLGATAYGYGISVTPLHIATFYNGIANHGRMMKPYLVESIEKNGKVIKKFDPTELNGSICSPAAADTVIKALRSVVVNGTATRLKQAKLPVAGKTGTARVVLSPSERGDGKETYIDSHGRKKNQGTFVGMFPADNPKYTIMVTVYSYLTHKSFYGGTIPALAVREIVDKIYAMDGEWDRTVGSQGEMPSMAMPAGERTAEGEVPSVKGMGLKDALYTLESAGYLCTYEGAGHVVDQTPHPGEKADKGKTVKIVLK